MMKINFKRTQRGFRYVEFIDHNDVECRLQKSSIADDDAIWLGCNDANPRVFIPGDSWQPFKPTLPKEA